MDKKIDQLTLFSSSSLNPTHEIKRKIRYVLANAVLMPYLDGETWNQMPDRGNGER